MNSLIKEINKKFDDEISVIASEENLKFKILFDNEDEENNNQNENENCAMIVELFQYEDGRYLLEFMRTEGGLPEYYEKFLEIKEITQKLL